MDRLLALLPVRSRVFILISTATTVLGLFPPEFSSIKAHAQAPCMVPEVEIDQKTLMEGKYSFRKVMESGRHLFSTNFILDEGYGEGPEGPRRSVQTVYDATGFYYLRLNGLDSHSCFECHFTIGSDHMFDTESEALSRKVGAMGGAGGIGANAFPNPDFPNPMVKFIRNSPHVFGTGYVQQLAEEMSLELMAQRDAGRLEAMMNPGSPVMVPLSTKGVEFGSISITYQGSGSPKSDAKSALLGKGSGTFEEDFSGLEGVSEDLVVRGLQWKGIASNERNFVKDALVFHFGIEGEELFYELVGGEVIISATDRDRDGVPNEISPGNVSALTVFTIGIRPPARQIPPEFETQINHGEALFSGTAPGYPEGAQSCADCHVPTLRMNSTLATVLDPTQPENLEKRLYEPGLSTPRGSSEDLPVVKRYQNIISGLDSSKIKSGELQKEIVEAVKRKGGAPRGYQFDLTDIPNSLPLSYPRLPENATGEVDVPLFSDLKRHKMGAALTDVDAQQTDVRGIFVPAEEFLTRPLWGVGDTSPYLHDGRASTLREAILLHQSAGSEANEVVDVFKSLSEDDQQSLILFLMSLRLPEESTFTRAGVPKSGWSLR